MLRTLVLTFLLALAAPAYGGDPEERPKGDAARSKAAQPKLSQVLEKAFELRRRGELPAAALGFEEVLGRLRVGSPHRQTTGLELAQLYLVMQRPERAVGVYRRLRDLPREVETLLAAEDARSHREALVVSRKANYKLGEARALAKLGKLEEALKVLDGQRHLLGERARLLLSLKRYREAAAAFGAASDYLGRARATWLVDREGARRLFADAAGRIRFSYEHEIKPALTSARARLKGAQAGVAKDRERVFYAQCLGRLGQTYRDWAECLAMAGQGEQALKKTEVALKVFKSQRNFLGDQGTDRFGLEAAKVFGVDRSIAEAERELAKRRGSED